MTAPKPEMPSWFSWVRRAGSLQQSALSRLPLGRPELNDIHSGADCPPPRFPFIGHLGRAVSGLRRCRQLGQYGRTHRQTLPKHHLVTRRSQRGPQSPTAVGYVGWYNPIAPPLGKRIVVFDRTNSSPDITQTPSGNAPLPAWTSKPYGGRIRGLVQPDRAAAGQTNRGFDSPRRFVNRRASDSFGRQRLDHVLQLVAHQVKLRAQHRMRRVAFRGVAIFGMHSGFRWRQLEDEPAMPGIHRAKLQHIPAECPIRFRIVAIEKNMSTRDHGTTLPLGADDEQVPTPENRRRRPALHSANVSGAQCRGVSFALEAADPLLPTLGPFPLLRMSRMGVSRSCGLLPDMPRSRRSRQKTTDRNVQWGERPD